MVGGAPYSCALLRGFAIAARISLLWQQRRTRNVSECLFSLCAWLVAAVTELQVDLDVCVWWAGEKCHLCAAFKVAGECLTGVQVSQHFRVDAIVGWLNYSSDSFIHQPPHISATNHVPSSVTAILFNIILLANVNSRSSSLYAIARPSVCRLFVVCNARAPYSGGSNFRQYF